MCGVLNALLNRCFVESLPSDKSFIIKKLSMANISKLAQFTVLKHIR